jgi:hypothetical protein
MRYEVGPHTCGQTLEVEADSPEDALEIAIDEAPEHFEEFHSQDDDYEVLSSMSRVELAYMIRPMVHMSPMTDPAFRESLLDEDL